MSYYHQRAVIVIGLFLFVTSAYYQEYAGSGEYYPFFSWSLFSIIPNPHVDYTITVREIHGQVFDPPKTFLDMRPLFEELGHSPTQYTATIVNLAQAWKADDTDSYERNLGRLNAIFGDEPFIYEVVEIEYDPIVYYRTGNFVRKEVLFTINSRNL